ncbi:MAG TPA: SHOCT domain-containing protein [bacterium]|nr:SHOCT domain-containing protein [bacterium]
MYYGDLGYGWMGWLGFGLHGVGMLVFWGLLIWGGIALFRVATRGQGGERREDAALAIVKERYARGELTQEQYTELRKALH